MKDLLLEVKAYIESKQYCGCIGVNKFITIEDMTKQAMMPELYYKVLQAIKEGE